MWLACHKKSYLICEEITHIIFFFQADVSALFGSLSFVLQKKNRNRFHEHLKIRDFVTYQVTFLMTCQQHWIRKSQILSTDGLGK